MVLRASADGGAPVHVTGPGAVSDILYANRHLFRWVHPRLLVDNLAPDSPAVWHCSAFSELGAQPLYRDQHLAMYAIFATDVGSVWPCPGDASQSPATKLRKTAAAEPVITESAVDAHVDVAPVFHRSDIHTYSPGSMSPTLAKGLSPTPKDFLLGYVGYSQLGDGAVIFVTDCSTEHAAAALLSHPALR